MPQGRGFLLPPLPVLHTARLTTLSFVALALFNIHGSIFLAPNSPEFRTA